MYDVLAVDDFKVFITQLKRMNFWKENPDFNLKYTAADGSQALDILKNSHVDILITDIKMPKLNGLELLECVKQQNLCPCTILLSEYTEFEYARKGIVLGAFDYIIKPVKNDSIKNVLLRAEETLFKNDSSNTGTISENSPDKFVEILSQCIISAEDGFEVQTEALIKMCSEYSEDNFVYNGVILSEMSEKIYKRVCESYPWISNVVSSIDKIKNKILQSDDIHTSESILSGFLREMFVASKSFHPSGINKLTGNIVEYILNNISDKLTLTKVADACYVNKSHMSHIFKQNMGISFVDYIVNYKMQALKIMISESDMKLQEMSEQLGYDDYKYMGRLFKNIYGITPSDYKKMHSGIY